MTLLHRYTYTYDDGDNMTAKEVYETAGPTTTTTNMSYSSANELTSSTTGAVTTAFAYDAWGRMTQKADGTHTRTSSRVTGNAGVSEYGRIGRPVEILHFVQNDSKDRVKRPCDPALHVIPTRLREAGSRGVASDSRPASHERH